MTPFDASVDCLATYRLTRLVTTDYVTRHWRERRITASYEAAGRYLEAPDDDGRPIGDAPADPAPPPIAKLVTCDWCASAYVAVVVVTARRVCPRLWDPAARVLAMSAVSGMIASRV